MTDEINPRYATTQLVQSLRAADAHTDPKLRSAAEQRVRRWTSVVENIAKGLSKVGQRQPRSNVPVWVTPIVLRGGFASGDHAAGGPLMPHETAIASDRAQANASFLLPAGLDALDARLRDRAYRITAPEEGALLAMRWLIERGENESAARLVEGLSPFFDRLRFHPQPATASPEPVVGVAAPVLFASARQVAESLMRKTPSASVEAMRESYEVWAPLTDAMVSLVLETVVDGMPFRGLPADFETKRAALVARYAEARTTHTRCKRPHRSGEILEVMHRALAADDAARGWTVSQVKNRLDAFVAAHGAPGSEKHTRLRAAQRTDPSHAAIGHVVAERLRAVPETEGVADTKAFLSPALGASVPKRVAELVARATEAPIATLIERDLVRSAEGMAMLLPQLSGPALATRFTDPRPRALYAASYRAFRARRSLLLLYLQNQIRFGELPWIAALETAGDRNPQPAIHETLREIAALAITSFPGTQMPNKLVAELTVLTKEAGVELPLVEEVAADIFMGTFSIKFLRAAQLAARSLSGSLYARYYGLPYDRVLKITKVEEKWQVKTSPDFDALCLQLAELPQGGNPRARNGTMIEQASILTTHNLAVLIDMLELELDYAALARTTYSSLLDRLENRVLPDRVPIRTRMQSSKQLAFGWRQMLFFLSRAAHADRIVAEMPALLAERSPLARERFGPVLEGLERAVRGATLPHAERLYGWSVTRPRLLGPASTTVPR